MSESRKTKRYTAKQKVEILREHLENQVRASEIAGRYGVHPSQILRWKKQLFEGGVEIFWLIRQYMLGFVDEKDP